MRALVICGPTAAGKSAIALQVATLLRGEIVNADSRQIYRGMEIGTGTPSAGQRAQVPHHLYGFLVPAQRYSAARYVIEALPVISNIARRGHLPIVVGGTGFYIEALTGRMPLDRPGPDEELRERLHREARLHPTLVLWEWLHALAPALADNVRRGDSYRILRALETVLGGGIQKPTSPSADFHARWLLIRLCLPKPFLHERIARRVTGMFESGLVEEAVSVRSTFGGAPALTGIGYAEALAFYDGCATKSEALARSIARTDRYAKRQETWFRHLKEALLVDALNQEDATRSIESVARERLLET